MVYRRVGSSGLKLSVISLGTWTTIGDRLSLPESIDLLSTAYELGINFFDNAETYAEGSSEVAMGDALKTLGWPRESFVVSSKVYWGTNPAKPPNGWGLSRKHVREACDAALRRLQLEYLDLYFCHRPDPDTPIAETVTTMTDLIRQGKILYWGTSEWAPDAIRAACRLADERHLEPPIVEQPQYNLLARQRVEQALAGLTAEFKIGLTTWAPLAYGLLSGKYDSDPPADGRLALDDFKWLNDRALGLDPDRRRAQIRTFSALARDIGTTPSRLALAWVISHPQISSAITGATKPAHLIENVGAVELVAQLDDTIARRVSELVPDPA
jgi:voltage-dependent potassium channel beta subunit